MRISGLVQAIKGFTHMDQATLAEPVDLTLKPEQHRYRTQIKGAVEIDRPCGERGCASSDEEALATIRELKAPVTRWPW